MIVSKDELKHIHTNAICHVNKVATKFAKVNGIIVLGEKGNKLKITLSINGIPIWPSWN